MQTVWVPKKLLRGGLKSTEYSLGNTKIRMLLIIKLNSAVLVRKRTIPTERPQPAGEVSANFS
jgi:hypothetical protein